MKPLNQNIKMENKTAVQQVFSELETLFPNYFNVYTTEGKEFINHFHKFLAIEKEQKHAEYMRGWKDGYSKNETFKSE